MGHLCRNAHIVWDLFLLLLCCVYHSAVLWTTWYYDLFGHDIKMVVVIVVMCRHAYVDGSFVGTFHMMVLLTIMLRMMLLLDVATE